MEIINKHKLLLSVAEWYGVQLIIRDSDDGDSYDNNANIYTYKNIDFALADWFTVMLKTNDEKQKSGSGQFAFWTKDELVVVMETAINLGLIKME